MCTYNGAPYIQKQMESIGSQTRRPDELIVCDDRSHDNTIEIVKILASKMAFPVHININKENLGSTKNFEKAIKLCQGDIITLCDQDDVWHPEKLNIVEKTFSHSNHIGVVFTNAELVDKHLRSIGQRLWESIGFNRTEQKRIIKGRAFEVLLKHNVVTGATMAFRSEFKDLILPIPENWIHDAWIALLIAATSKLAVIQAPLIRYRQHSKQQIGVIKKRFIEELTKVKQTNSNEYLNIADKFKMVYKRLSRMRQVSEHSEVISQINAKISHYHTRANMPKRKLSRLPIVFKELVNLRDHRYSQKLKSAAKDIFF